MDRQAFLYAAATVASLGGFALHAFGGGVLLARPFYRIAAEKRVRTQSFRYCWHFVSLSLLALGAGYGFLATSPGNAPFGIFLTASAAAYSALSIAVARIENAPALKSPPTILGAVIAAFGSSALLAG